MAGIRCSIALLHLTESDPLTPGFGLVRRPLAALCRMARQGGGKLPPRPRYCKVRPVFFSSSLKRNLRAAAAALSEIKLQQYGTMIASLYVAENLRPFDFIAQAV